MDVEDSLPLVDEILGSWRDRLGSDYEAYRNHVMRMLNFCFALRDCDAMEREKVIIAGCFHDLGIWSGKTFDYLPPSVDEAKRYLALTGHETWSAEVELMIDQHHKLRRFADERYPLVEVFRRGDLADFSLGIVKAGVPKDFHKAVVRRFPNAGFHKRLVQLEAGWLLRHPLRPVPVLKW